MKEFYLLNKMSDEEILEKSDIIIKSIRKISELSQRKFGDLYHIPKQTIADWEKKRCTPPVYTIEFLYTRVMLDFGNDE